MLKILLIEKAKVTRSKSFFLVLHNPVCLNISLSGGNRTQGDLFNAVLADINRFADMAVNDERAVKAIEKRLTETDQSKAKAMEKEQKKLNKQYVSRSGSLPLCNRTDI